MAVGMRMLIKDPHKNFKIERLKTLGATTFAGTRDPSDAKIWMDMLEKCFDVMGCPTDRKVRLATFLLQGGASDWWKSIRSKRSESEITNWSEFKKAFYEEYYPRSYTDAKRSEFLILVQGSMTVAEYEKKYTELSKYAATIIKDEIDKCRRFENGLQEEIRTCINVVEWREFRRLVEAALKVEQKEPSKNCGKIHLSYNYEQSDNMRREYPLLTQRSNVLQESFSQPKQSKVQVGQGDYMVQAIPIMKDSEGPNEPKPKEQVGTPCTQGKMFVMTQQDAHKLSK